jgi:hypothetical protein
MLAVATSVAAAAAFAAPPKAGAAWVWGFNYLGPYTSTGNGCYYATAEVCSGWNTWFESYDTKNSGGTVQIGFDDGGGVRGFQQSGTGSITVYASDVGWSGHYMRGMGRYISGSSSYIQVETCVC